MISCVAEDTIPGRRSPVSIRVVLVRSSVRKTLQSGQEEQRRSKQVHDLARLTRRSANSLAVPVLLQSLNAQAISEFIQKLAQFGAQRNAMVHPLAVKLRRALTRQPDFVDAR